VLEQGFILHPSSFILAVSASRQPGTAFAHTAIKWPRGEDYPSHMWTVAVQWFHGPWQHFAGKSLLGSPDSGLNRTPIPPLRKSPERFKSRPCDQNNDRGASTAAPSQTNRNNAIRLQHGV